MKAQLVFLVGGALIACERAPDAQPETGPAAAVATSPIPAPSELANYRVTMDDIRRYVQATTNLEFVAREHPELEPQTRLNPGEMDKIGPTLRSDPRLTKAVEDAGLETEHYAILSGIILIAGVAAAAPTDSAALAVYQQMGIHPDNYAFFKRHAAEIAALGQ